MIFFPHQPSLAKREKAAAPKPNGRRRAVAASYGSASHPRSASVVAKAASRLPKGEAWSVQPSQHPIFARLSHL